MTGKLHALVIDDEPDITTLVAEVLRAEGWEVTEASSAEEAFNKLEGQRLGAVFCDINLGGRQKTDSLFSIVSNSRCRRRRWYS